MTPTLVILAAGMASRYGSMKQTEGFGPAGETIMDYSIYDAIRSGFGKIVFIIRKDFADRFEPVFNEKLKGRAEVAYVYQELDSFTNGYATPASRTKPWGTAHAILCAKDTIHEPFAVINADDFYGRDAFEKAVDFLTHNVSAEQQAIIGYELAKTLSDNGTVSRGVCVVDEQQNLVSITERTKIYAEDDRIVYEDEAGKHEVPYNSSVSMNFWCFDSSIFSLIETGFQQFLQAHGQEEKSEFFIPLLGDAYIKQGLGAMKVITTAARWFGVTYKEDAPLVKANIDALVASGAYPVVIWSQF